MQHPAEVTIRPAAPAELPSVLALLEGAGLPTAGADSPATRLWVAETGRELVGSVGLEVHGGEGLLRSLAVDPAWRGAGIGARLVGTVREEARREGLRALFLLTTTADGWFVRLGFERVRREDVPAALEDSEELRGACPAGAAVLRGGVR